MDLHQDRTHATPQEKSGLDRKEVSTIDGKTLGDVYLKRVKTTPDLRAYMVKRDGVYQPMSWSAVHDRVLSLAQGLKRAGIRSGDRVCIMSNTRPEWTMTDLANLCLGIVTVPIYHSSSVEDISYILEHCGARLVFVEDEPLARKLAQVLQTAKISIPVVSFAEGLPEIPGIQLTGLAEFSKATESEKQGVQSDMERSVSLMTPDSLASVVYTSGTTGQPKGVVLSHGNIAAEIRSFADLFGLSPADMTLAFLPFAHILGRIESMVPMFAGITTGFAESINAMSQNMQELKPTVLISVPRIYEKIYAKIHSDVAGSPALKQKLFHWAVSVGKQVARLRSEHKNVPLPLLLKYQVADQLVFTKVREKLGGRIRFTISGGAPLASELSEFFAACGILIMEGWGLTETTAAITVNRPDDYAFGTVGRPLGAAELRIASDGEILVRGPTVFKEYYRNPEATQEVFSGDNWFHTGDIGEITARGALRITDRKKELIVTSGGKNIAPQKLENLLKQIRFVSNAMVYGDKKKYLVALITLNEPEAKKWAKQQAITFSDFLDLTKQSKMQEQIEEGVKKMNKQLASYESIKKFALLPTDFTVESGELTPSLKIKRKICIQKFQTSIDSLYDA